jgi:hypothetical protein
MAAKYRATGQTPKKLLGCFWSSNFRSLAWKQEVESSVVLCI